jgi:hypothetical protein
MLGHFTDSCHENFNWLHSSTSFTKKKKRIELENQNVFIAKKTTSQDNLHTDLHILFAAFMSRLFSPIRTISYAAVMLVTSAQKILCYTNNYYA